MYNCTRIDLRPVKIVRSRFEVVAAIGRRVGQRRNVLVVGVYLPPGYDAEDTEQCLKYTNDTLIQLRRRYTDRYIILAGDFNKLDVKAATKDFPDIKVVPTGPTRGRSVLDIIATSAAGDVVDSGTSDPIETPEGVQSDHRTVFCLLRTHRVPNYSVEKYEYFCVDDEGREKISLAGCAVVGRGHKCMNHN